jgi:hypothetical protein
VDPSIAKAMSPSPDTRTTDIFTLSALRVSAKNLGGPGFSFGLPVGHRIFYKPKRLQNIFETQPLPRGFP